MKPFSRIKGIFFDLYGTLLDYNDMEKSNQVWLDAFHKLAGIPNNLTFDLTKEICKKILLEDLDKAPQDSLTIYESKIQFHFEKCGVIFHREQLRYIADESLRCWQENITLSEDVIPVLQKLQVHKKLGLISNFDHTPHAKKVITGHGLDAYLNPIIISDEVGCKKPDSKIFKLALEKTNLTADKVVYVGDSYTDDILGAKSADILPVMIKHKSNFHAHNKHNGSADIITIQSLSELPELLS